MGAGAARSALDQRIKADSSDVRIYPYQPISQLTHFYEWANTAVVSLADWPALEATVPSKLFELFEHRIHVTGVVSGETRELIESLGAGHAVAPGDPVGLASLWCDLANNPSLLHVGEAAADWVRDQREKIAPENLQYIITSVGSNGNN